MQKGHPRPRNSTTPPLCTQRQHVDPVDWPLSRPSSHPQNIPASRRGNGPLRLLNPSSPPETFVGTRAEQRQKSKKTKEPVPPAGSSSSTAATAATLMGTAASVASNRGRFAEDAPRRAENPAAGAARTQRPPNAAGNPRGEKLRAQHAGAEGADEEKEEKWGAERAHAVTRRSQACTISCPLSTLPTPPPLTHHHPLLRPRLCRGHPLPAAVPSTSFADVGCCRPRWGGRVHAPGR